MNPLTIAILSLLIGALALIIALLDFTFAHGRTIRALVAKWRRSK